MSKVIKSSILILLSINTFGHTKNQKPVDKILSTGTDRPASISGYGYLNSSSEAQAQDYVNFVCPRDSQIKELEVNCVIPRDVPLSKEKGLKKTFHALNEKVFDQRLRDKVFEYVALQKAAGQNDRPVKVNTPSCVTNRSILKEIPNLDSNELERVMQIQEISKGKNKSKLDYAVKLNAIKSSRTEKRLIQAILLNDQYNNMSKEKECDKLAKRSSDWDQYRQICNSIAEFQDKLKLSYPTMFRNPEIQMSSSYKDVSYNPNSQKIEKLRSDTYKILGSVGVSEDTSEDEILKRGKMFYELGSKEFYGMGWDQSSPDILIRDALDSGDDGFYNPDTGDYEDNNLTKKYINKMKESSKKMLKEYDNSLDNELRRLCGNKKVSTKELAKSYPQVLRQLLLDSDETNFDLTKNLMCKEKLNGLVQKGIVNSCVGVSGDIDDPEGMDVDRYEYSFPFGGKKRYSIKKKGDELIVSSKINFNFIPDSSSSESVEKQREEFKKKVETWKKKSNEFYSSLNEKITPKVKIEFDIAFSTEEPSVNVSKCYNRSLPEDIQYNCEAVEQEGGSWQDAGNFTLDIDDQALSHEMGHQLGLDDEYTADYYPMLSIGEEDSVMNSGTTLYPRHLRRIIQPALRCGQEQREELTPRFK